MAFPLAELLKGCLFLLGELAVPEDFFRRKSSESLVEDELPTEALLADEILRRDDLDRLSATMLVEDSPYIG